jgi:hypothetical protein
MIKVNKKIVERKLKLRAVRDVVFSVKIPPQTETFLLGQKKLQF